LDDVKSNRTPPGVDDVLHIHKNQSPLAADDVDTPRLVSIPNPVPRMCNSSQALLGNSCRAPKNWTKGPWIRYIKCKREVSFKIIANCSFNTASRGATSGVDLDFLEQTVMTRNDFAHNIDLLSAYVYPDAKHGEKHPASAFRDPAWGPDVPRITVTEESWERP
jgi:hypothetical protein